MRILAMSDIHGAHEVYRRIPDLAREHGVEVVVLAGDLLGVPGGPGTIEDVQRKDAARMLEILSPLTTPLLYVMGNDDMVSIESEDPDVQDLHGRRIELGAFNFVGYVYSLPFMGGVHEKPEAEIEPDIEALEPLMDDSTVLVTHSPAAGILDIIGFNGEWAGSPSIGKAVERRNVRAHIHGHIHRRFGRHGRHFNVAASGRTRGMVLDLEALEHTVIDE